MAHTYSEDADEDYRIRDAVDILRRRCGEEYIHLTDTERLAILREEEMAKARLQLEILRERKDIISFALEQMEKWYHEQYLILWHKYVMGKHWKRVCEIAARDGQPLTDEEYRLSRKKALKHFDRWAYGLR